jgi:hypothetical protein
LVHFTPFGVLYQKIWQPRNKGVTVGSHFRILTTFIFFRVNSSNVEVKNLMAFLPTGLPDGFFSDQTAQFWVYFGGPLDGNGCFIFESFVIFHDHWVYFMGIW